MQGSLGASRSQVQERTSEEDGQNCLWIQSATPKPRNLAAQPYHCSTARNRRRIASRWLQDADHLSLSSFGFRQTTGSPMTVPTPRKVDQHFTLLNEIVPSHTESTESHGMGSTVATGLAPRIEILSKSNVALEFFPRPTDEFSSLGVGQAGRQTNTKVLSIPSSNCPAAEHLF